MANTVVMPKMGLTMTEGMVSKWLKREGDSIMEGEALFEVETDKLVNEVASNFSGVILKLLVDEGEMVPCIAPIAYIGEAGENVDGVPEAAAAALPMAEEPAKAQTFLQAAKPAAQPGGYVIASPAAKHLAKERGLALEEITPTGQDGAVLLRDVERFTGDYTKVSGLAAKIAQELGVDIASLGGTDRIMSEDVLRAALSGAQDVAQDSREPLNGMRKTISRRMTESWHVSPRVCYTAAIDCTQLAAARNCMKKEFETAGIKLSYNHLVMLAVTKALQAFPAINASLEGDTLIRHTKINIGLAVGVEKGLLVPNLKGCERMGLMSIAKGTEEMIASARNGSIGMDALSDGTFTITNLGMYGIKGFSPIINQPELAILGLAAIIDTPVAIDGQVVIRPMMELNLVADHRVIDGVMAAGFLQKIVSLLETPAKMLL